MKKRWEKPEFEYVPLGAEVTAYLGASTTQDHLAKSGSE
jgi:coenzyme PQQ precursor peptide PqqA